MGWGISFDNVWDMVCRDKMETIVNRAQFSQPTFEERCQKRGGNKSVSINDKFHSCPRCHVSHT